jgi:hypothetical protein
MSSACLEIAERTAISRARSPFLLDSIFEILIKFFHVNTQPLREREMEIFVRVCCPVVGEWLDSCFGGSGTGNGAWRAKGDYTRLALQQGERVQDERQTADCLPGLATRPFSSFSLWSRE